MRRNGRARTGRFDVSKGVIMNRASLFRIGIHLLDRQSAIAQQLQVTGSHRRSTGGIEFEL
jgi:hypothetical protein